MDHISIFDLDHTLFNENSSFRFGIYLYQQGIISLASLLFILGCNIRHKLGMITIPQLHQSAFKKLFLGRNASSITDHANHFLDRHFEELTYLPALKKLQTAQNEGHLTIILSSSPDFLVGPIAQRFRVDRWEATRYAVDRELRFCAISKLMLGEDKAKYIEKLLEQLKLSKQNVTAYSDSHVDLPFLMAAGNAVGVNPNKKLKAICKENNWPII